ncbi:cytochrome P450 [Nocardia sp. CDC159]|uniref:Cytochrome P450 n=1 Tax=Nocardia pulmonis TaxID=2951408 RepID=A0A9X2IW24_9NOCA|nr:MULTISPECIES: cytochrome P450 [Nocardia]MCM6773094.1 cytochrome P450 [Nocardia pulmonis]MCM6785603.1 cytochrome P450 [Nocardia sp. CDC159]
MSGDVSHAVRFELRSGASWRDPWPMYSALREHDPVHHVVPPGREHEDYYVLSRYADVYAAVRDPETFSSAQGLTVDYNNLSEIGLGENRPFVFTDPPDHTAFRRLVARGFTPRQVAEIRPAVTAFVVERLDRLRAAGGGDIVAELFKPLPTMVVAHYLGVPQPDRPKFDEWSEAIVAASATGGIQHAQEAVGELMGYFATMIERRRLEPADDTISHLVAAGLGADGDVGGMLRILGFAFTMITGGNDTTTGNLGGAVQLLVRHPEQRRRLLDDPSLVPGAVDEFLRLTSPVQGLARTTTRAVRIAGVTIPPGRRVLLLYASANRDEREFGSDAEELDVTRHPRNILSFGNGNHHCLGAAAARMQATIALQQLLARCPRFTVDLDGVRYAEGSYVRRPVGVPFRAAA